MARETQPFRGKRNKALKVATLIFVGSFAIVACSNSETQDLSRPSPQVGASVESSTSDVNENSAIIVDVRTPEEFNAGHLEGAVNINLQSGNFVNEIRQLDPNLSYDVYCRSGNRSAEAVEIMKNEGFTDVEDYGGLQEAANDLNTTIVTP